MVQIVLLHIMGMVRGVTTSCLTSLRDVVDGFAPLTKFMFMTSSWTLTPKGFQTPNSVTSVSAQLLITKRKSLVVKSWSNLSYFLQNTPHPKLTGIDLNFPTKCLRCTNDRSLREIYIFDFSNRIGDGFSRFFSLKMKKTRGHKNPSFPMEKRS